MDSLTSAALVNICGSRMCVNDSEGVSAALFVLESGRHLKQEENNLKLSVISIKRNQHAFVLHCQVLLFYCVKLLTRSNSLALPVFLTANLFNCSN